MSDSFVANFKAIIQAQLVEAFSKNENEAINNLVRAALEGNVDEKGRPVTYSGGIKFIDWLTNDLLREEVRVAMKKILQEKTKDIETELRERLSSSDFVEKLAKAVVNTTKSDWKIDLNFIQERF